MKNILVPIDFSDHASYALDFALQLNKLLKGKITLLHVLEHPTYSFNVSGETGSNTAEQFYHGHFIKGVRDRLQEWSQKVTDAGQEVTTHLKEGNAYQKISSSISEEKANYIVIGSKGASRLQEIFVGSTAERVIRNAACPVFTIKGPTKISAMKNLVFASDLTEAQDWIAEEAKEIQELLQLNMHIVKVKTPYNLLVTSKVEEQLNLFVKRNFMDNYTTNVTEAEFAEDGIIEFAEEVNAGLIVMGTHGRTGIAHLFGGSNAEAVANKSKIPVLTFKIDDLG